MWAGPRGRLLEDGPRPRAVGDRYATIRACWRSAGRGGDRLAGRSDRRRCARQAQLCGHVGRPGRLRLKLFQQHNLAARDLWRDFVADDFRRPPSWPTRGSRTSTTKTPRRVDFEATTELPLRSAIARPAAPSGSIPPPSGGESSISTTAASSTDEEDASPCQRNSSPTHYLKQFTRKRSRRNSRRCAESPRRGLQEAARPLPEGLRALPDDGPLAGVSPSGPPRSSPTSDMLGFDAISIGGVVSWLMGVLRRATSRRGTGSQRAAGVSPRGFRRRGRFGAQCRIGVELLDAMVARRGLADLGDGARALAGGWRATRGKAGSRRVRLRCVRAGVAGWCRTSSGRPASSRRCRIVGQVFMYTGRTFCRPAELGRRNPSR